MNNSCSQYYIFLFVNFFFILLLIFFPDLYTLITYEDHIIEFATCIGLFATSMIFLFTLIKKRDSLPITGKITIGLGVLVCFFGAGEEISWGQRIFDIPTPESIAAINDQNELNIHNIDKKFFDRLLIRATILISLLGTVCLYFKKHSIFGINLPSYPLVTAFALVPLYHQYNNLDLEFYHFQYLVLALLLFFAMYQRNKGQLLVIISALICAAALIYFHYNYNQLFPAHNNSGNECREFLFSLTLVFYAYNIYHSLPSTAKTKNQY